MKKPCAKALVFKAKQILKILFYHDRHCMKFVKAMNKKAADLGMSSSVFVQPDGAGTKNKSTAEDLLLSVVAAYRNEIISSVWTSREWLVVCKNKPQNPIWLQSTLNNDNFKSKYKIIGGKTGSWSAPTKLVKATYNISVVSEINGHIVAAVIVNAVSDLERFSAIEELLDIAAASLNGEDTKDRSLSLAMGGAVCEILPDSSRVLFSQNPQLQILPASLSKLVTLLVACEHIGSLDDEIEFSFIDMVGGSGNVFEVGDIITIKDALYAALLPSSNSAIHALSRTLGKKL